MALKKTGGVADETLSLWHLRTLTATKNRLKGANTGHKLLKKKSDALTVRIRMILRQVGVRLATRFTRSRSSKGITGER